MSEDALEQYADFFSLLLLSNFLINELAEFTLHKLIFYMSYFTMLWQVVVSSGIC